MKALFTARQFTEIRNWMSQNESNDGYSQKPFWTFLLNTTTFFRIFMPPKARLLNEEILRVSSLNSKTTNWHGTSVYENHFEKDYSPPPESPPPICIQSKLPISTPKFTSIKSINLQIMNQLSSPPPRTNHLDLRSRFDEKSKQWVSFASSKPSTSVVSSDWQQTFTGSTVKTQHRNLLTFCLSSLIMLVMGITSFAQVSLTPTDLSLRKQIDNSQPALNGTVKFTVWAKNESGVPVTNVIVKDEFPSTGATITGTTTTMGTTFNSMTGQWTIPTLAAMDSVKLEITATVIERGVFFNKAEVMSMGTTQQQFEDEDSTPNNKMLGEDDYATACFSVPLLWYPGDEYTVTPDAMGYSNVEWIKVGTGAITGIPADSAMVKGDTLVITGTGRFAFTAKVNTTCPATGCCDIIVVPAPLGSIGDFVWKDINDNGRQDAGEQGVNGVRVILWSANGSGVPIAKLDSTTTATVSGQAGKYSFNGLDAGNYVVQFVSSTFPAGCLLTPKQNQAGVPDSLDSDANPTTGVSQLVVLDPSKGGLDKNNPTIDAGLFSPLGSIGDFVWKDVNDNGRQDAGEQGVNGVRVILWSANGSGVPIAKLDSTTTATVSGQAGKYSFDGLAAGNYVVQFVSSTFPAGCLLTPKQNQAGVPDSLDSDANPTTGVSQLVVLDPSKGGLDKNNPTIDAGLFSPLGSIGDFVWKDADNDGIQDAIEQGVNGVKMVLYQKNQAGTFVAVDTVTTANSPIDSKPGYYLFEGLLGGEYQVGILKNTLPTGCVLSDSTNKGGDDTKDSDFNPITGLSPTIVIDPTKGGISKDNPTVDGALRNLLGSIGDYVWKDSDNDGIQDATEDGVNGVRVILWSAVNGQPSARLDTMVTITKDGKKGYYTFNELAKGDYIVQIDKSTLPVGCVLSDSTNKGGDDTKDNDFNPSTGLSPVVSIDPAKGGLDQNNPTIDAALYSPLGSIGDFVWKDRNDNGLQDSGEPGLGGVRVILWTSNGTNPVTAIDTTFTQNDGSYLFSGLAGGQYQVQFDPTSLPDTCFISKNPNVGGNSNDDKDSDANPTTGIAPPVTINPTNPATKDIRTVDAGLVVFDLALTKSLANGQSADVLPGADVTFTLTVKNEGSMTATQIMLTDSLPAGMSLNDSDWEVVSGQVVKLKSAIAGPLLPGATASVDITVKIAANATGNLTNFAQIQSAKDKDGNPAPKDKDSTPGNGFTKGEDDDDDEPVRVTPLGSIGDFVWKDRNDNGLQDGGEPGLNGVKVILWNGNANGPTTKRDSMLTSGNGGYLFTGLPTGTYFIQVDPKSLPDTCFLSKRPNAGDDAKDSDVNPTTGVSPAIELTAQKRSDLTIDAAVVTFDLALTKSLANGQSANVKPGDNVNFTLTVKNEGSMTATAIMLTDLLPTGMSLAASETNWEVVSGQTVKLKNAIAGPLAPGASVSVNLTVKIAVDFKGTSLTNVAQITSAKDKDGNPAPKDKDSTPGNGFDKGEDDDDDEPVFLTPCVIPPTPTCLDDTSNVCPETCVNLMTFILGTPRTEGGVFEWWTTFDRKPGTKVADPTKVCSAGKYYLFEKALCGEYSNAALINIRIKACEVPKADLSLVKTVSNKTPEKGAEITYTIKVTNAGPATATNVEVTDKVPAGIVFVSSTDFTLSSGVLTAKIASIAKDATATLTFKAIVTGSGTIKNFAQVSKSDQPDPDSTPGNDTNNTPNEDDEDDEDITVKEPCVIPPTPTCGGMGENTCPDTCVNLNSYIHSAIRTEGGVFEWWTTFDRKPGTKVANPAKVCTSGDYYLFEKALCGEYSNGALLKLKITPCAPKKVDLSLAKVSSNMTPSVGDEITYTITVSNALGMATATNVEVKDLLPASLQFVSSADFTLGGGGVLTSKNIPSIPAGGSVALTVKVKVLNEGAIVNKAQVSKQDQEDVDSTPGNGYDNGEDDRASVTINAKCVKPEPPVLACATTNICPGESTSIHAIGCEGGTVMWSNGATGATITVAPMTTTSYTATCKKGGCESVPSNVMTINVSTPSVPTISASPSTTICKGSSVTLTAANCAGTLKWNTGATSAQIVVSPEVTTQYSVYCQIGKCQSEPAKITITVNPAGPAPEVICSTDKVCPGESVTLEVKDCAGTVEWSTGQTGAAIVVTPAVTTSYWALCNVNGCKSEKSKLYTITVTPLTAPTISASPSTTVCKGGSVTLNAANCSGTVTWSNGQTGASIVVSPASTTTYTATCKVGQCTSGASNPLTITVGSPEAPSISANPTLICAGQSSTLTATGCDGGTIVWSNGATGSSISVSPMATTEYTAVCKVATCESAPSNKVKVTVNTAGEAPKLTASKPSICAGEKVTLTAEGCTGIVKWSTGATGASIEVSPATTTTYTASCTGATGKCDSAPGSVTVTVGNNTAAPTISASPSTTVCAGTEVTLTAAGCTGGTITWNTGATGSTIKVTPATTTEYSAICKIGNCESNPAKVTITVTPAPEKPVVICSTDKICPGEEVTLEVKNCAGTVMWSTGETGPAIVVKPMVTTSYTAKCKVGACESEVSATYTITVTPIAPPTVTAAPSTINLGQTSTLTATGCDGEITWSNGMTGASIVVTPNTTTSYTATCKIGKCISAASVPVTVTVIICKEPSISSNKGVICEGGSAILTATGCEGGTVEWSTGATGTSITVSPMSTTTYTAVCKKGDCTSNPSAPVTVTVTKVSAPTISASALTICKGESATLTANGCNGSVLWSNGATTTSITVSPETTTSYTVKCKVGECESPASVATTITVGTPNPVSVTASKSNICFGEAVTLTATGDCAGFILWSNGQVGQSITITPGATADYTAVCCVSPTCKSANSNAVKVTVAEKVTTPQVNNLSNVCPVKTVDLMSGVRNYVASIGTVEFRTGNSPSSPLVSNPAAVGTSGTYYVFFRSSGGCYSAGVPITVNISSCEPTPCSENPATADAGADAAICAALEYKLNGKIGGVAQSATWSTNGTGKFSNALALGAIYYPSLEDLIKGEIILTLTTNDPDGNGPCTAGQDQMKLVFEGIKFRPQIIVNGVMKTDTMPQTINICQGDTVKLKASEGSEYQIKWIKDGKILFPASDGIRSWHVTEPGTYSYQLVDSKRCCSYNSAFITVNVSTTSEPLTTNLRNTCPNTTVNLLDGINSSNTSVQFRTGNTSTSPIVATPSAVGAGMYYAFNKVGSCFSAPAPIEVKIFNCASDTVKPDVRITKMVDKAAAGINDVLNYKIVVKNLGKGTATNIDICDKLPESELVSAGGMNIVNGILKTRITTLAANDSVVYNVSTRAKKVGTLTNLVEISYMDQTDPNTANNVATASTVVSENGAPNPGIGVALAVTGINKKDGDPVNYDVTYKVTVKNTGNVALTNVQVCDSITKAFVAPTTFTVVGITVPNGGTLVKNDAYNGTSDLKFLAATGNNLAVGEEQYFFVTYNVKPNGNNGPIPGSVVATGTGNSTNVSDKSNRGTEVNQPVDNTTPVRFDLPSTLIGLSKSVGTPVSKGSGQFEIPYTIAVTNLGTNDLKGVQVIDDLGKTFGAQASVVGKPKVVVESGFAADTNYTGQGLLTNLLVDTLSTLPKGATRKIDLTVTIMLNNPDATTSFNNIAIGKGMTNGGAMTSDTSTTGANADPDFDLDPRNNSEPTGVTLNSSPGNGLIGVALSIKDTVRNGDGSINIKYRVIVKNFGAGLLTNVQVSDSLTRVFNRQTGASFQVVGTPTADDASTLRINPDFDGDRDVNLLIAEQSQLAAGKLDSLFFTVNVTTDGRQTPYLNRVAALANAGQVAVNDLSTDGVQPDLNGNNDPTEATEAEFTAIIIPGDGGLFVPEGFSPNGDGINDKFVIRHPSGTKVVVEIYNRWMNLVYRHNDYQNDWEGQANVGVAVNNQGLPAGTYFYNVILSDENGGEIKRVARFMTINR